MNAERYEQLKATVHEYGLTGSLDMHYPIGTATLDMLNITKKDSCSLLSNYCTIMGIPLYPYYGFELTGRTDNNKFLCLSEHNGQVIFGVPCISKKNAKSACALRVLDILMAEGKLQNLIGQNGRKIKKRKVKNGTAGNVMDGSNENANATKNCFAEDVDFESEFKQLNPILENCPNREAIETMRNEAFKLFTAGYLYELKISPATQVYLDSCGMNTIVPIYAIFTIPSADKNKYVCLAQYEGDLFYGCLSQSKQIAKSLCAAVIAEKFLNEGRMVKGKKANKKRAALSLESLDKPFTKQARVSDDLNSANDFQLVLKPEECLSVKTIYHLILNLKNPVVLLIEFCAKNKLPQPNYIISGEINVNGLPEVNKKSAKSSAAKLALNAYIENGTIHVAEGAAIPPEQIMPLSSEIHEYFKSKCYRALSQAAIVDPIMNYCNSKISGIFLVDVLSNQASSVSWATGSHFNTSVSTSGDVINDCDSIVLTRRGLLRFLYDQVKVFVDNPENSIFYRNDSGKLCLRPNLSFHMYSNDAPSGDAVEYLEPFGTRANTPVSTHNAFDMANSQKGGLSVKTSSNNSASLMNQVTSNSNNSIYLSMSSSDKMLKWNAVGIQGCLLHHFIEPIFIESLAVGKDYDANHLSRAICSRALNTTFEAPFKVNQIYLTPVTPVIQELEREKAASFQKLAANWNAGDDTLEIVNPVTGRRALGGISRLSRRAMFQMFCSIAKGMNAEQVPTESYREAKSSNVAYGTAVKALKSKLQTAGMGIWITKDHYEIDVKF
ncbi:adenosine-deaminase (editase) domain-containing protein [Ditylenchus destructor]|uniref:Adenosine-deaminase (Editase) domain-containing protein n=1 Tax=Ditylenchus destructor TaxID=166010 RepID=A0AAD4N2E4_9BILA|nr:adenosine-deaminase (editase) domain-containing protein [Ditylenchus destructor]